MKGRERFIPKIGSYDGWMERDLSSLVQLCPTLCDPMDYSLPGSSVHGITLAIILEWVSISFSRGSSWLRDWACVSCDSWAGSLPLSDLGNLGWRLVSLKSLGQTSKLESQAGCLGKCLEVEFLLFWEPLDFAFNIFSWLGKAHPHARRTSPLHKVNRL